MTALRYDVLDAKSPEYLGAIWSELTDLYVGGYQIQANAERYLPQLSCESHAAYKDRTKCAGYISYLGQIVDYFTAALFVDGLTVTDAADADDGATTGEVADETVYSAFAKDADLRGAPFERVARCAFTTALVKRRALIAVDFPAVTEAPATRAEEDAAGASRPYAFEIPVEQLIDWEHDESVSTVVTVGKTTVRTYGFSWAILKRTVQRRASPEEARGKLVDEFKVWRRAKDGSVTWELYQSAPYDPKNRPQDADAVALVVEPQRTSFRRIPLVELALPDGLWVGNKIGPLAREHFQRRTMLVSAENASLVAIPVVELGPQAPAVNAPIPADVAMDQSRGDDPAAQFRERGFMVLASGDKLYFAEPTGGAYELVDKQLASLKDEMFRVVHQMAASVDNSASSMRRSGESKVEDRAAEAIVLGAFGALVRDFAVRVYDVIAEARGEEIVWQAHGLDDFATADRAQDLEEALSLDAIEIPSPTFKKTLKTQLAFRLLGPLDPRTRAQISEEIEAGVDHEEELRDAAEDAAEEDPNGAGSAGVAPPAPGQRSSDAPGRTGDAPSAS